MDRKWPILLLVIVLFSFGIVRAQEPQPGADGIGDSYFPQLGNGGYDTQHYTLDLTADMNQHTIAGTVTIEVQATQDLSAFDLDFVPGFAIDSITVNDSPAKYSQRDHELIITPTQPLQKGNTFTVAVTYSGKPRPIQTGAIPISLGWINYSGGSYVASEPEGASGWYPVNDHPLDKAAYTFRITVAKPYVVAANGLLKDAIDNGDTTTYVWEARDPIASYLVTVDIAEYVIQAGEGPNGLPIRNYFPPEIAEEATRDFARTDDMIAFYNSIFGPYPFEAYGVVVVDTDLYFALETQTLTLFARNWVDGTGEVEDAAAHELAHQWFGDSISLSDWKDIWLNEGFATYASWLWTEHDQGPEVLNYIVTTTYQIIASNSLDAGSDMSTDELLPYLYVPPGNPPANDLFNSGVYDRGGLTLHALRLTVGDETFFNILRTYAERYQYGNATTADFISLAEEISGQDLDAFFDGWLYANTMPDIPQMGLSAAQ